MTEIRTTIPKHQRYFFLFYVDTTDMTISEIIRRAKKHFLLRGFKVIKSDSTYRRYFKKLRERERTTYTMQIKTS